MRLMQKVKTLENKVFDFEDKYSLFYQDYVIFFGEYTIMKESVITLVLEQRTLSINLDRLFVTISTLGRSVIVFTVSLLNCFELYGEIKKLIDEFNICIIINVVIYPEHYSVRCLPQEFKDKIILVDVKRIEDDFPEVVTNMIALYSALESSSEKTFEENASVLLKDLENKDKVFNFNTNSNLSSTLKSILNKN